MQEKVTLSEKRSRAELSSFAESYWSFCCTSGEELILFPDGTFNLVFASAPFTLLNTHCAFSSGFYLVPLSSSPIRLVSSQAIYGIRFKAFSLPNMLKGSCQPLTTINALESLNLSSAAIRLLSAGLKKSQAPEEVLMTLEKLAFELLTPNLQVNQSLRDKVNYILHQKGHVRIEQMAHDFNLSRQGLHKHFIKSLRVSPKQLSTIWQLNHFFTLPENSDDSLTGRALDAGYYDQAHFNHQFSTTFGSAPNTFFRTNSHVLLFAKESMIKRFTNYYDPET